MKGTMRAPTSNVKAVQLSNLKMRPTNNPLASLVSELDPARAKLTSIVYDITTTPDLLSSLIWGMSTN